MHRLTGAIVVGWAAVGGKEVVKNMAAVFEVVDFRSVLVWEVYSVELSLEKSFSTS